MEKINKVIIIGSGPAGLTAAIYASRADLNPILFAGESFGGQLMLTTEVENFPGFPNGVMGPELMQNMIVQAEKFGTKIFYKYVTEVDFSSKPYKVKVGEEVYETESVIIATGAKPLWLGLENEMQLVGKGLSTCATCDAAFYRNKSVAVIGGGDTAMEEALHLAKFATSVTIIHRREEFRASKAMQQKVFATKNISVIWNSEVKKYLTKELNGEVLLGGATLFDNKKSTTTDLMFDGIFLAIGHEPVTSIFEGISKDQKGYILTQGNTQVFTNIEGVYVCGDAKDHHYRQAIVASGAGCMAAMEVEKYLLGKQI